MFVTLKVYLYNTVSVINKFIGKFDDNVEYEYDYDLMLNHYKNFYYATDIYTYFINSQIQINFKDFNNYHYCAFNFLNRKLNNVGVKFLKKNYTVKRLNKSILLFNYFTNFNETINDITSNYSIKFLPTNVAKYLNNFSIDKFSILFLRKNKIFNKGRYSRNRQFYRTGVYWCLYINIIAIIGFYFWFYRFTFNFSYIWWIMYISLNLFIFSKLFMSNFYNFSKLLHSIKLDFYFYFYLLSNLSYGLDKIFKFKFNGSKEKYNIFNFFLRYVFIK